MLGEQIGQETGKVIVRRVLASEGSPKVEVSVQSIGTLLGIDTRSMATYTASIRPDGSLFAEGQGLIQGPTGERGTWKGQGVGKFGSGGAVSYRGALYIQSDSERWNRLNTIAVVYEYEADGDGNSSTKFSEWR